MGRCISGEIKPSRRSVFFVLFVCLAASSADAGFSLELRVDGGPPMIFPDNSLFDKRDAIDFEIEVDFVVSDVGNNWTAAGTIIATGGGGFPPVSTIVTDTLIEKQTPGLHFGMIEVVHNYAASGITTHMAEIDGEFRNTNNVNIGGAEIFYTPTVNGFGMGTFHEGPIFGELVHPFDGTLGPLVLPTTTEHKINIGFYLDEPGDAIELFDSIELHTAIPEPASAMLLLLGFSGWCHRRMK